MLSKADQIVSLRASLNLLSRALARHSLKGEFESTWQSQEEHRQEVEIVDATFESLKSDSRNFAVKVYGIRSKL